MDAIKRLFSSPGNESEERIAELEEKYAKIKESLAATRAQLTGYTECRAERDLYHTLMAVIASHQTFETLLDALAAKLADLLNARYSAVFMFDAETDTLTLAGNHGYVVERMPEITRKQSLMGQSFKSRSIIWEPEFRTKSTFFVDMNQNPVEYNVLLIPVFVFNVETAVIRLGNIDEKGEVIASTVMRDIIPMISSQIERLHLVHRSEQSLKSLEATFSIAKLLENTLNDAEILRNLCAKVPRLIPSKACVIALAAIRNQNKFI